MHISPDVLKDQLTPSNNDDDNIIMYTNLWKEKKELEEMKKHFTALKAIGLLWRENKVEAIKKFCESFDIDISDDSNYFTLVKDFQSKTSMRLSFIEGIHRAVALTMLLCGLRLTTDNLLKTDDNNEKELPKYLFEETIRCDIQPKMDTIDKMKQLSKSITMAKTNSFSFSFGHIISTSISFFIDNCIGINESIENMLCEKSRKGAIDNDVLLKLFQYDKQTSDFCIPVNTIENNIEMERKYHSKKYATIVSYQSRILFPQWLKIIKESKKMQNIYNTYADKASTKLCEFKKIFDCNNIVKYSSIYDRIPKFESYLEDRSEWFKNDQKNFLESNMDLIDIFHRVNMFELIEKKTSPGITLKKTEVSKNDKLSLPFEIKNVIQFLIWCCRDKKFAICCQENILKCINSGIKDLSFERIGKLFF